MKIKILLRPIIYLLILLSITIPNYMYTLRGIKGTLVLFSLFIMITIVRGKMVIKKDLLKRGHIYTFWSITLGFFWILIEMLFNRGIGWEHILYLYCSIAIFIICDYIMNDEFSDQYHVILKIFVIIWGISLLTSFSYGISNQYVVKYVTGGATTLTDGYIEATKNGIGNSIYYLGIATILPLFIARLLEGKYYINRVVDSVLIALLILNVFISVSVTALSISILGIILIIILNLFGTETPKNIICKLYFKIIVLILCIVIGGSMVLNKYSDNEGVSLFVDRLTGIISGIGNSGEIVDVSQQQRELLKDVSINTFKAHPILGNGTAMASIDKRIINGMGNGNHASFFDILAMYGIVGGMIWFMLFWGLINISKNRVRNKSIILERGLNISILLFCISMLVNPTLVNSQYVILIFIFMFNLES